MNLKNNIKDLNLINKKRESLNMMKMKKIVIYLKKF